ncbi:MAG: Short-chain dehydrogenase/reductase [Parcubacteria group bacterium]|nr:Short-chain dehydrogenase/reductase [Parcubacteria group bacterium]
MEIKGKVAIVTGASEGIGKAVAQQLAAKGATVVLAARSADKLAELAQELPGSFSVATDMTRLEDVQQLVALTMEKYGRIDILVNNAGRGLRAPIEKIDMQQYREVMELNVFAVLEAMQAVIPLMRTQGSGLILNVSSMVSKNFYPGLAAYASTKYALNALSLTARTELEPDDIVVSVFHPKMTATEFGANSAGTPYVSSAGRPGMSVDTAEDVAHAIVAQIESEAPEANM